MPARKLLAGVLPMPNDEPIDDALAICQSSREPLSFCHRMSDLVSPLKSPTPMMCQSADTPVRKKPVFTEPPFICQVATTPLSLRQTRSALWSPSKSPKWPSFDSNDIEVPEGCDELAITLTGSPEWMWSKSPTVV